MKLQRASWIGARAPRLRALRLRDAGIFCALIWLSLIYLLGGAVIEFQNARAFDDWYSRSVHLRDTFWTRVRALKSTPSMLALRLRFDPEASDPEQIRLQVDRGLWQSWQSTSLPHGGEWIPGTLVVGNRYEPVKLRKRGDTSVHWTREKKSFTLKTQRSRLFRGHRRLGLSVKTPINQVLSNGLAREFGLLAPATTLAAVFVNDRFYGLHRANEIVDESFLRRNSRLPGNVFRGDTVERGEVFHGVPRNLFVNPSIWDRVAKNDRPSAPGGSALHEFLRDLNGSTFEAHRRLFERLDRAELSGLVAYLLAVGDPYHLSNLHNQFWYEDPSSGALHPIPWDIRLFPINRPSEWPINDALRAVLRDPRVLDGALRELSSRIRGGALLNTAKALASDLEARLRDPLGYEEKRFGRIPLVGWPGEELAVLRANLEALSGWLGKSQIAFHAGGVSSGARILDFEVRGPAGSDLVALEIEGSIPTSAPTLVADRTLDGRRDPRDRELRVRFARREGGGRLELVAPEALLPGIDAEVRAIRAGPLHYRYFLELPPGAQLRSVRPVLRNRFTHAAVDARPWAAGTVIATSASWHPWLDPEPRQEIIALSGEVALDRTLIVPEGSTLVVAPGTTLRLGPDVSILARGRVMARGDVAHPITIESVEQRAPWGALALQGAGASESVFEHVRFVGGGGAALERVEYKGMVSVHWARNVRFEHCTFARNLRSDDALNAVHADVSIVDSRFLDANADAVDFDYSTGEIRGNRFDRSGNDAIDLMGSSPRIVGNTITGSGDKGVSIGERSAPLLFRNRIETNGIGVEVKDGSEPVLVANRIAKNKVGVGQSAKNWRYGAGGWAKLFGNHIVENRENFRSDARSRLSVPPEETPVPDWLLAELGLAHDSSGELYETQAPRAPALSERFADDFTAVTGGWSGKGGLTRLEKRDATLLAWLRRHPAVLARPVDWDLDAADVRYVAVFELGGKGFSQARLSLVSNARTITRAIEAHADLSEFRFVALELPPGHYRELRIAATPGVDGGRIALRGFALHALPR